MTAREQDRRATLEAEQEARAHKKRDAETAGIENDDSDDACADSHALSPAKKRQRARKDLLEAFGVTCDDFAWLCDELKNIDDEADAAALELPEESQRVLLAGVARFCDLPTLKNLRAASRLARELTPPSNGIVWERAVRRSYADLTVTKREIGATRPGVKRAMNQKFFLTDFDKYPCRLADPVATHVAHTRYRPGCGKWVARAMARAALISQSNLSDDDLFAATDELGDQLVLIVDRMASSYKSRREDCVTETMASVTSIMKHCMGLLGGVVLAVLPSGAPLLPERVLERCWKEVGLVADLPSHKCCRLFDDYEALTTLVRAMRFGAQSLSSVAIDLPKNREVLSERSEALAQLPRLDHIANSPIELQRVFLDVLRQRVLSLAHRTRDFTLQHEARVQLDDMLNRATQEYAFGASIFGSAHDDFEAMLLDPELWDHAERLLSCLKLTVRHDMHRNQTRCTSVLFRDAFIALRTTLHCPAVLDPREYGPTHKRALMVLHAFGCVTYREGFASSYNYTAQKSHSGLPMHFADYGAYLAGYQDDVNDFMIRFLPTDDDRKKPRAPDACFVTDALQAVIVTAFDSHHHKLSLDESVDGTSYRTLDTAKMRDGRTVRVLGQKETGDWFGYGARGRVGAIPPIPVPIVPTENSTVESLPMVSQEEFDTLAALVSDVILDGNTLADLDDVEVTMPMAKNSHDTLGTMFSEAIKHGRATDGIVLDLTVRLAIVGAGVYDWFGVRGFVANLIRADLPATVLDNITALARTLLVPRKHEGAQQLRGALAVLMAKPNHSRAMVYRAIAKRHTGPSGLGMSDQVLFDQVKQKDLAPEFAPLRLWEHGHVLAGMLDYLSDATRPEPCAEFDNALAGIQLEVLGRLGALFAAIPWHMMPNGKAEHRAEHRFDANALHAVSYRSASETSMCLRAGSFKYSDTYIEMLSKLQGQLGHGHKEFHHAWWAVTGELHTPHNALMFLMRSLHRGVTTVLRKADVMRADPRNQRQAMAMTDDCIAMVMTMIHHSRQAVGDAKQSWCLMVTAIVNNLRYAETTHLQDSNMSLECSMFAICVEERLGLLDKRCARLASEQEMRPMRATRDELRAIHQVLVDTSATTHHGAWASRWNPVEKTLAQLGLEKSPSGRDRTRLLSGKVGYYLAHGAVFVTVEKKDHVQKRLVVTKRRGVASALRAKISEVTNAAREAEMLLI